MQEGNGSTIGKKQRRGLGIRQDWTVAEFDLIERHFHAMTIRELQARYLPHRTLKAIAKRAHQLGLKKYESNRDYDHQPWTGEELRLVAQHYPALKAPEIRRRFLPHRSVIAIRHAARKLGLRAFAADPWTEEELATLRREFPIGGAPRVKGLLPHRSEEAIKHRARAESVSHVPRGDGIKGDAWSAEELQRLEANRALPAEDLAALFPHRHKRAVIDKRHKLKWSPVRKWSTDERQRLHDHLDLSMERLCEMFPDRPREGVRIKRDRLRAVKGTGISE